MGFEDNPAEEDPHGECAHEIHTLESRLTAAEERLRVYEQWKRAIEASGDKDGWANNLELRLVVYKFVSQIGEDGSPRANQTYHDLLAPVQAVSPEMAAAFRHQLLVAAVRDLLDARGDGDGNLQRLRMLIAAELGEGAVHVQHPVALGKPPTA